MKCHLAVAHDLKLQGKFHGAVTETLMIHNPNPVPDFPPAPPMPVHGFSRSPGHQSNHAGHKRAGK